jgi:hypothetical protein
MACPSAKPVLVSENAPVPPVPLDALDVLAPVVVADVLVADVVAPVALVDAPVVLPCPPPPPVEDPSPEQAARRHAVAHAKRTLCIGAS